MEDYKEQLLFQAEEKITHFKRVAKEFVNFVHSFKERKSELYKKHQEALSQVGGSTSQADQKAREFKDKDLESAKSVLNSQNNALEHYKSILSKSGDLNASQYEIFKSMSEAFEVAHSTKVKEIETAFEENVLKIKNRPDQLRQSINKKYEDDKQKLIKEFNIESQKYELVYSQIFESFYETSHYKDRMWETLDNANGLPFSYVRVAHTKINVDVFGKSVEYIIPFVVPFFNKNNLLIKCSARNKQKALDLASAVILRGLLSMPLNLKLKLVDTERATRNFGELRGLNSKVYGDFVTDRNEVGSLITSLKKHVVDINHKLSNSTPNLLFYNQKANVMQNYNVFYFTNFVNDCNQREFESLENIFKNGPEAGVNGILVIDKDELSTMNDKDNKFLNAVTDFERLSDVIDIDDYSAFIFDSIKQENVNIDKIEDFDYEKSFEFIDSKLSTQTSKIISFNDYLLPQSEWWKKDNSDGIISPVGILVEENKKTFDLKLSLEADNFSGVITGTPGQGKSSLYHTFICNAITHYSPKELQLYLIDLKGVEFEMYARENMNIPHVSVVASNSEREFALNVIEEFVREGKNRSAKYAKLGATDLWSYNSMVSQEERDPIKILLIDEFIQLFAVSDKIQEKAYDSLMSLIQVYRAFGILVLTASQSLKTGQQGLNQMIELIPMRLVFRSGEADNMELLKQTFSTKGSVLQKLAFPGQFVFNNNFGDETNEKTNKLVQSFFITNEQRKDLLIDIAEYAKENLASNYETRVYDLSKPAKMEDNKLLSDISGIRQTKEYEIFLGKTMSLAENDVYFSFKKEASSNLLIVGGENEDVPTRIAINSILGIMLNTNPKDIEFYVFNGMEEHNELNQRFKEFYLDSDFTFNVYDSNTSFSEISKKIEKLKNEVVMISEKEMEKGKDKVIVFIQSDRINFGFDNNMKIGFHENLKVILEQGCYSGYHTIIQSNTINSYKNNFDDNYDNDDSKKYFKHRVALQMVVSDAYKFVDDDRPANITNSLKEYTANFGYYFKIGSTTVEKFNTYKLPSITWIKQKLI